jgi:hypothetical protein
LWFKSINRAIKPMINRNGVKNGAILTAVGYSFSLPRIVKSGKKQDTGCQSSQEQVQWDLPVPDMQVGIDVRIHPAADDNLFSHEGFRFRLRNRAEV